MLNIHGFPMCCGADIITGFSYAPTHPKDYKRKPSGGYEYDAKGGYVIEKTQGDYFLELIRNKADPKHRGIYGTGMYEDRLYMLVLNDSQFTKDDYAWPKLLKQNGFELVKVWNNSVHKTSILRLFVKATLSNKNIKGGALNEADYRKEWDSFPSEPPTLVETVVEAVKKVTRRRKKVETIQEEMVNPCAEIVFPMPVSDPFGRAVAA